MSFNRPILPSTEIAAIYGNSLSPNYVQYNAAIGVFSSYGETAELISFIHSMEEKYIHSFLGSTFAVVKLQEPLIVYRVGDIGNFWSVI